MKAASVPRPLAELILRTMHEDEGIHHEGWTQRVTAGWYIVRQSAHYRLLHGRMSLGNIEDLRAGPTPAPAFPGAHTLEIEMASGLVLSFPIREPRGVKE